MEPYLSNMKADYDQLVPVSDGLYKSLSLHLEFKKAKKGELLKRVGEVEKCSRYICYGFVGTYSMAEGVPVLQNIFQATDAVFDAHSYITAEKTNTEIRVISETAYFEFSKIDETWVVGKFPEFAKLGIEINHRIQQRKDMQNAILRLGFRKGYSLFCKLIPGIQDCLHYQDWVHLFNSSERTVSRVLNQISRPGS